MERKAYGKTFLSDDRHNKFTPVYLDSTETKTPRKIGIEQTNIVRGTNVREDLVFYDMSTAEEYAECLSKLCDLMSLICGFCTNGIYHCTLHRKDCPVIQERIKKIMLDLI